MLEYGAIDDTFYFHFAANDTGGSGADGATPICDVRLCGAAVDAAPVYEPTPSLLTHANYMAGLHEVAIVASAANGFAAGNTYAVFCSLAVDSENPSGFVGKFKIDRQQVHTAEVSDDLITAASIATGAFTADAFAADALVAATFATGAFTADAFAADAIVAATFATGAISDDAIAADAITAAKIADDAIATEHIATGALTADSFAADALVAATFATGCFTADVFAADALVAASFAADYLVAINGEVLDCLDVDTYAEASAVPSSTAPLTDKINYICAWFMNKVTQTSDTQTLRTNADDDDIGSATTSDNGTTFTRGTLT